MIYSLDNGSVQYGSHVYIANTATVVGDVVIGDNVGVWFGAVIRGDNDTITIGNGSNVQDCCVLHTDPGIKLTIGNNVTIGHKAMLHGCTVGDGSLIGINAVILNHAVVGKQCLVGANTLIGEGKEIPDNSLVVGTPGRVIRQLKPEESEMLRTFNQSYIDKIARYKNSFREMPYE